MLFLAIISNSIKIYMTNQEIKMFSVLSKINQDILTLSLSEVSQEKNLRILVFHRTYRAIPFLMVII
jgi:hypothetical protein